MNPLTQFKKIRILPLLIAPALIVVAVFSAAMPARATPACALGSQTLAVGHFSNGLLNLKCNEFDQLGGFSG